MIKRWLPSPMLSLALFIVWLLLNEAPDAATLRWGETSSHKISWIQTPIE